MIAGLLPQDRGNSFRFELPAWQGTYRASSLRKLIHAVLIVVDFDVVDLDSIQDAILAFSAVLHSDGRTYFDVSADLFFGKSCSAFSYIGDVFTIPVGDRASAFLDDERRTRCVLSKSS
jgi:hypothetical protein